MNFGFLCYGNKGVLNLEISSTDTKADEVTICQGYKSLCFYCRSSSSVLCCDSYLAYVPCLCLYHYYLIFMETN